MSLAIEMKNICAGYRGTRTLRDITLSIQTRRIVGISGPNGSGKTTLLRTIQGMLPASSGFARILDLELVPANYREIRRMTACVFQTLNVDPRMPISAGEVVMMGRYGQMGLFSRPAKSDNEAVEKALALVDATHLASRPFGQLSGGEQQRINLARAVAQEPKLLLLDEPTTFLDSESQQRVRQIIRDVHLLESLTTIVVSHDADVLADLCDEIVLMRRGTIERIVSSREFADV